MQTPPNLYRTFIYCQLYCIEKSKIKEKEAGNGPFFKKKVCGHCGEALNPSHEKFDSTALGLTSVKYSASNAFYSIN